jgi:hypothetical protein
VDSEAEAETPSGTHVVWYSYKEHTDYQTPNLHQDPSRLIASEDEMYWEDGHGGKRRYTEWRGNSYTTNLLLTEYFWPPTRWPQPLPTGISRKWSSETGRWQTNSLPQPAPFDSGHWEHCDVDFVTADGSKHIRRTADTSGTLSTGGKAIAGRKSLFEISAGMATAISDEDLPNPTTSPIPSEEIRLGTIGTLGNDGKRWVVLPDGLP